MHVELSDDEVTELQEALATYLSDLRFEIVDTDNAAFRSTLRHKRAILEAIAHKLGGVAASDGATGP